MDWKQHLTATEAERLEYLETTAKAQALATTAERRLIYDRARARMRLAKQRTKAPAQPVSQRHEGEVR